MGKIADLEVEANKVIGRATVMRRAMNLAPPPILHALVCFGISVVICCLTAYWL
jgi:hypothetical protein